MRGSRGCRPATRARRRSACDVWSHPLLVGGTWLVLDSGGDGRRRSFPPTGPRGSPSWTRCAMSKRPRMSPRASRGLLRALAAHAPAAHRPERPGDRRRHRQGAQSQPAVPLDAHAHRVRDRPGARAPRSCSSRRRTAPGHFRNLLQYVEPPRDAGKRVLLDGRSFWFFDPASQTSVRISAQQRLVGQAAIGDVLTVNLARRLHRHPRRHRERSTTRRARSAMLASRLEGGERRPRSTAASSTGSSRARSGR